MMKKVIFTALVCAGWLLNISAQIIEFEGRAFEMTNVKASLVLLNGEKVLKVERDLHKIPFDAKRLEATVDEPTFVKLNDFNFVNGIIEVKVLSRIQNPSPFEFAQGFIGLAFKINETNTAFESIYLRPNAGRAESQIARNHAIQYFSYPDFKFERLRKSEFKGQYETYADIGLDEWISLRIEINDKKARLYINNQKYPSFIVGEMLGTTKSGSIGLWVDIGTEGYFKDFKIIKQ